LWDATAEVVEVARRLVLVLAVVLGGLTAPVSAVAIDVNGDGYHDAYPREQPYLPYANVGSNCDVWKYDSPWHARLYVRPPAVWGLPALGRNQRVAWRAQFYEWSSGDVVAYGRWVYARVNPRQGTTFGGGPDAGNGVMITHRQYWQASQYYDHLGSSGERIKARVVVAWRRARGGSWIVRRVPVSWVIATTNRTIGQGQTGPSSTPVRNYTC
jgi:hypothetical protein